MLTSTVLDVDSKHAVDRMGKASTPTDRITVMDYRYHPNMDPRLRESTHVDVRIVFKDASSASQDSTCALALPSSLIIGYTGIPTTSRPRTYPY